MAGTCIVLKVAKCECFMRETRKGCESRLYIAEAK
jgi:hypothetical protein